MKPATLVVLALLFACAVPQRELRAFETPPQLPPEREERKGDDDQPERLVIAPPVPDHPTSRVRSPREGVADHGGSARVVESAWSERLRLVLLRLIGPGGWMMPR